MALIMNCLDEENRITVGGNTFTFAPRQIKHFYNEDIAQLIVRNRKEAGFIEMPSELEYLLHPRPGQKTEDMVAPEHKSIIEQKRIEGVQAFVQDLRRKVYNAQVSLARDLARANYKHDVKYEYSDGDIHNMETLAKYQTAKDDTQQNRFERAKELEKKLQESNRGN